MAPNDKDSMARNQTLRGGVNEDKNTTLANAQDQTLLKALQDLIVRVVDPTQNNDMKQMNMGLEAGKLITALQDFISSIVNRSQFGAQNTIEVILDDEEKELQQGDLDDDYLQRSESNLKEGEVKGEDNESSSEGRALTVLSSSKSNRDEINNDNSRYLDVILQQPQPTFQEKLLTALREHVFNTMPIRLLCFEPHGLNFQITLLERGAIYSRLALVLQEKMHEDDFRSQWGTDEEGIEYYLIHKYARYAILSHTWLRTAPGEVTYGDWNQGLLDANCPGYGKLVNFCKAAWKDQQFTFGWMDTICINKESSSELDESIRSMYTWYSRAAVCIIYLAETTTLANMHNDPWFTRGWTLQELLAPHIVKFYNGHWRRLVDHSDNDKKDANVRQQIERATTILKFELDDIRKTSISRRMQLAATREVTREEDTAYSLMGIFNISMSIAYGEGAPRAFFRLLQEILASSEHVWDVLNWAGEPPFSQPYTSHLLPPSPKYYINRSPNAISAGVWPPIEPLAFSHLGLRVPFIMMPGFSIEETAPRHGPFGDYNATVQISPTGFYGNIPTTYDLLNQKTSGSDGRKKGSYQISFAVFSFTASTNFVYLPKICKAIGLLCARAGGQVVTTGYISVIRTNEPIVFNLHGSDYKTATNLNGDSVWAVGIDRLEKHGMQLISDLYL